MRVYASISTYSPARPFRPWLYTIAKHLAWKKLRQRERESWVSLDESPKLNEVIPDPSESPAAAWSRQEAGEKIRQAVEALPEEQKRVFILHHYHGLSYEEIAVRSGCPVGTVKSRMHYALAYLRRRLFYLNEG
jgi:RNA polymerase sigma-70 factor (ECF subfamily)